MFSTELPERVTSIETDAFAFCHSLRNVAIPHNTVVVEGVFDGCTDLRRIPDTINSLQHRFDNLPSAVSTVGLISLWKICCHTL